MLYSTIALDRMVGRVEQRIREHCERIAALEKHSLDATDEREQAAIAERDLTGR
jgi:hypothetical protein